MKKLAVGIVVGLLVGGATIAVAQGLALSPGTYDLEEGQYVFNVPELLPTATPTPTPTNTATPTPTPTETPVPPTDTPSPANVWHAPTDHEHGDVAPQWVLDSPLQPTFDTQESHSGFKGFYFFDIACCGVTPGFGLESYIQVHIISIPGARLHQLHSFKAWILDDSGNVSYWQGFLDAGDPAVARFPKGEDPGSLFPARIICDADGNRDETWYTQAHSGLAISWVIGDPNYICNLPEDPDPSTWVQRPSNNLGFRRSMAEIFVSHKYIPIYDEVYIADGLPQFAQSTLPGARGTINSIHIRDGRLYDCPDCEIPN